MSPPRSLVGHELVRERFYNDRGAHVMTRHYCSCDGWSHTEYVGAKSKRPVIDRQLRHLEALARVAEHMSRRTAR